MPSAPVAPTVPTTPVKEEFLAGFEQPVAKAEPQAPTVPITPTAPVMPSTPIAPAEPLTGADFLAGFEEGGVTTGVDITEDGQIKTEPSVNPTSFAAILGGTEFNVG
jgi:hypothetical protein